MFVLLYRPIKKSILKKKYVEIYGKKIYLIARDFDYFLINNFDYKLSDGTKLDCHIGESDKLKKLQSKVMRQKDGSNNKAKTICSIRKK